MSDELAPRRVAITAAAAVVDRDQWSTTVVPKAVGSLDDARDRSFASHLAYELVRWHPSLDALLEPVSNRSLAEIEDPVRWVLRLGALQLWRSDVPDHAAVATSVKLVKEYVPRSRGDGWCARTTAAPFREPGCGCTRSTPSWPTTLGS